MDFLIKLNELRIHNGYYTKEFKRYKNFCNKASKKEKDEQLRRFLKFEANIAKFMNHKTASYLKKTYKLLKSAHSAEELIYKDYVECILLNYQNTFSADKIIDLRNKFADLPAFVEDIYSINNERVDFDPYKSNFYWNDIKLSFESPKCYENFKKGVFTPFDNRFDTQLAIFAYKIDELERNLFESIKNKISIDKIYSLSEKYKSEITEFDQFLKSNFMNSEYIERLLTSVSMLHGYIEGIFGRYNADYTYNLDSFVTPFIFVKYDAEIMELKNIEDVNVESLRKRLIKLVEDNLLIDVTETRNMPLLPITYDLAYDFIEYPTNVSDLGDKIKNLGVFNNNE